MNSIFIPKTITAGYKKRNDTYSQKLAYIIYTDEKGVLRKEKSWNSWRDKEIDIDVFDNEPISGLVLNKKAGGYSTGWNHRQTYVRVYDPRGMEFEITIANLLYILENTNSIKGKGLEGEFVYGWYGTELILIPTGSPDYKELVAYNKLLSEHRTIKAKELKIGATYRTKNNDQVIYMGRFEEYSYSGCNKGLQYYFAKQLKDGQYYFETLKTISKHLIEVIDDECVYNYADIFDRLERNECYSPIDRTKDEYCLYTFEEFVEHCISPYGKTFYSNEKLYNIREYDDNKDNKKIYCIRLDNDFSNKVHKDDLHEIYKEYQPYYLKKYLTNGRLYSSTK